VNSLPKTVTRQRRSYDLNQGPSAPESSTLTTRLPSHRVVPPTARNRCGHFWSAHPSVQNVDHATAASVVAGHIEVMLAMQVDNMRIPQSSLKRQRRRCQAALGTILRCSAICCRPNRACTSQRQHWHCHVTHDASECVLRTSVICR